MTQTRHQTLRTAAIACLTLLIAGWVAAITIGTVFAKSQPALAVAWSSHNAEAQGYRAMQLFREEPLHPQWPLVVLAARAALARSPANVPAVTMLAAQADAAGKATLANQLFAQSDRLSRHETLAQMYLIEEAVNRGKIDQALVHYDAALSTSRLSFDVLMPVLVAASEQPAVARPLAALLRRRPAWWDEFARRIAVTRGTSVASLPLLMTALHLDPEDPTERSILSVALERLIDAGQEIRAYALYRQVVTGPAVPEFIRDGGFEGQEGFPPFGWEFRDGNGVSGSVEPHGSGHALYISVDAGVDSAVASQRLLLPPGRYALRATIGSEDASGGETALSIDCGNKPTQIAMLRVSGGSAAMTRQLNFVVPSDHCSNQHLRILGSPADQPAQVAWVDDLTIVPTP